MIRIFYIAVFMLASLASWGQNGMLLAVPSTGENLILNDYPGAVAAYSLRLLNSSYSGNAIEVQRKSDNLTQDIGFSGGALDETTLSSFCSGTDCKVRTLYDQTGNGYDFVQTDTSKQARIVLNGVIDTISGLPSMRFDSSVYSQTPINGVFTSETTITSVMSILDDGGLQRAISLPNSTSVYWVYFWAWTGANVFRAAYQTDGNDIDDFSFSSWGNPVIAFMSATLGSNINININNGTTQSAGIGSNTGSVSGKWTIGANRDTNSGYVDGHISEIVIWDTDYILNISDLFTEINNYYSIY